MDEYISLQSVLDIASQYCPDDDGSCSKADVDLREMLDEIEALPTADVQPVKRGKWDFQGYQLFKCTNCTKIYTQKQLEDIGENWTFPDFCPKCGARMIKDGDVE